MIIEWKCHICGKTRPDACISVHSRDISADYDLPAGTMKQNVCYCNDNPDCIVKAPTFSFMKKDKDHGN